MAVTVAPNDAGIRGMGLKAVVAIGLETEPLFDIIAFLSSTLY